MALLALLGVFSGFLGGLLGVGGGVIVVPALILLFGLDSRQAIGTSLVMVSFTALSATTAYYRQRRIDWKVGLVATTVTVPGAAIGAYATSLFTSRILALIFGLTLFLIAAAMLRRSFRNGKTRKSERARNPAHKTSRWTVIWKRKVTDSAGQVFEYQAGIFPGLLFLFIGGLASGFLGIGGGLIVVPILIVIVGLPVHLAVATSMVTMVFTSISGVSTHALLGNVLIEYGAPLVLGIVLGAQLGAATAKRLRSALLERVFALAVLGIGLLLTLTHL